MEFKNFEIANIVTVLEGMAASEVKDIATKHKIGKLLKTFAPHFEDYSKSRQEIINECAEKDKNGEFKKPKGDDGKEIEDRVVIKDTKAFEEKMKGLGELEVDISLPIKFDITDLERAEVDLDVPALMAIDNLISY